MNHVARLLLVALVAVGLSGCCESLEESIKTELDVENKPGMKELRDEGCIAAVELLGKVQCTVPDDGALDCEKAAKVYGEATGKPDEIELAIVAFPEDGDPKVICEGVYDSSGKRLRDPKNPTKLQKRTTTTTLDGK